MARRRLEDALDALRVDDTTMTGAIGDANPLLAVTDALASGEFDEIILSTLPPGLLAVDPSGSRSPPRPPYRSSGSPRRFDRAGDTRDAMNPVQWESTVVSADLDSR